MFEVEWLRSAFDELTALWAASDPAEREAMAAAIQRLDPQLRSDPLSLGESRPEGRRIVFEHPLVVTYRVERVGSVVVVLHVWRSDRP